MQFGSTGGKGSPVNSFTYKTYTKQLSTGTYDMIRCTFMHAKADAMASLI